MPQPILSTKLFAPPVRPDLVQRPRLIDKLDAGLHGKLTLISASAGFGKSTLVSSWASQLDRPVAWLSVDENDSDALRFIAYLVAALNTVLPNTTQASMAALNASQLPAAESLLTILLNELAAIDKRLVLVLDDYHLVEAQAVDQALEFLLEHLPAPMHLVIATREDPPLSLARLRARGQMTELRDNDLRFTAAEASRFLNQAMGLELSGQDITALEVRTEGWIAGLQMAALSLQGCRDNAGFIAAFTGSHRFILDYLVEEVLQHQPDAMRNFLLQTSILQRMNGSLCDAVTGQHNGQKRLLSLERDNLFVVPLDDCRQWYRYHHLFGDVLRTRLSQEHETESDLHTRASRWFEQNQSPLDAIHHALAAGDTEGAARLVEGCWPEMRKYHPEPLFLQWLEAIPDERISASPVLCIYRGFSALSLDIESADTWLCKAERWRDLCNGESGRAAAESNGMVVFNESAYRTLSGMIAIARSYCAGATGDIDGIVEHSQTALDSLPDEESIWRGSAAALQGIAHWTHGDLDAAVDSVNEGVASMRRAGETSGAISALHLVTEICLSQGELRDVRHYCDKALKIVDEHGEPVPQGTADIHVTLAELHYLRGELDLAEQCLHACEHLGEHALITESRHRWYIVMARIRQALGDLDGAEELLEEARELQTDSPAPDIRPVAAWQARLALAQGHLDKALSWVRERKLSADKGLSYLQEFEHVTLAYVLVEQYRKEGSPAVIEQALNLLERLQSAAEAGNRKGCIVELSMLQALALDASGHATEAMSALESALAMAEQEEQIQPIAEIGKFIPELLQAADQAGQPGHFASRFEASRRDSRRNSGRDSRRQQAATQAPLAEPLSKRELEVLKQLGSELSGPEIAERLFVSLNTLRTHTKNIYSKLGVNNRRAAVRRAAELDLI